MAENFTNKPPKEFSEGLDTLIIVFIGMVRRGTKAEAVIEYIAQHGADIAPGIAASLGSRADKAGFFRMLGRGMWDATPLPEHGFRLMKLPQPGRNDPCFCGSGRKFKQCCAELPELPMEPALMLEKWLQGMPHKEWGVLVRSQIKREWVASVAYNWLQNGEAESVVRLLEPWFQGDGVIRDQEADFLDFLLEAYADLGKPRKRKALAQAATRRGERYARYIGWQRLALMELDAGRLAASHAALKEAMRAAPDEPSLGPLEVTLLLGENKEEMARERARFWLAKMTRLRDPQLEAHMDWLRKVVENPRRAVFNTIADSDQIVGRLEALFSAAPSPACHYQLEPLEGSTGPFEMDAPLAEALSRWQDVFPVNKPFSTVITSYNETAWDAAEGWLEVLAANPVLWHSFDVLDDLVCALDAHAVAGVAKVLVPRLLSRALSLFDLVLDRHAVAHLKCEWGWLENRPALRLLARKALDDENSPDSQQREAAFQLMRRLVEQLNPNDNHGFRATVAAGLIERGMADAAVSLTDKYPEDMADMQYTRALAFYAAGRMEEAEKAARLALAESAAVGKMLLAKSPRQPHVDERGYQIGSEQEAWIYREDFLPAWQAQKGALEWLAKMRK